MCYRLGVEDVEPEHYVAWALDLPGCFSSARSEADALARAPERIAAYCAWLAGHDSTLPVASGPFGVQVVETFRAFASEDEPDYLVNAFFEDDRRPLGYWDVAVGLRLLQWTREDLLHVVQTMPAERLRQPIDGEVRGSISGILEHIVGAENWYLGHLDLALDRTDLPDDLLARLALGRAHTRAQLPALIGSQRLTTRHNEIWSGRKVLRRALWHERDHTQQIASLAARWQ